MGTELIAAWIYKNGELVKQRMQGLSLVMATVIAMLLSFAIARPLLSWQTLLLFFTLATVCYYIIKQLSNDIFLLYKKIADPEDEEILFTSNKITSTKKTWILNDDSRKLVSVQFNATKNKLLVFKGTITKPGSKPVNYTIGIPVPLGELRNAEKICNYFKSANSA